MSTKILHAGDMHLGGSYAEKASQSIDFLLAEMERPESAAYRPDLIVCTGDTTDKALHVHSDHLKPLLKLIQTAQCQMVFLQGTYSHEPSGFLQNLRDATGNKIVVIDEPDMIKIAGVQIAALPAFSRATLQKWARERSGMLVGDETSSEDIIRGFMTAFDGEWSDDKSPRLLLNHSTIRACKTSTTQTLYSNDIAISLDDLALSGADAVLSGHIHFAQEWYEPIFATYCGSGHPANFGELDQKSFSIIEFEGRQRTNFQRIPFPHKSMVKVSLEFTGEQTDGEWKYSWIDGTLEKGVEIFLAGGESYYADKELKVCYSIPKEIAAQVDDVYVRLLFKRHGIDLAAVQRTIQATGRERIAEIATKETTRQQYEAVCAAKGEEPRAGALEKADELDTEVVCD